MPEYIPDNIREEIDYAALLSEYVYKDDQNVTYKTINDALDNSQNIQNDPQLKEMLSKIAHFEIVAQSSIDIREGKDEAHSMGMLIACAFRDPDTGEIYIIYRGTGDGKWIDNGVAMGKEDSIMQERALEFCDQVINKSGITDPDKIIVSGHSKGGNLAQYVTMMSEYRHLIKNCYSLDGQGFSPEAIEMFEKSMSKEEYLAQIDKMYSINGQNDYVHDLGIKIIPDIRTYFVETEGEGFAEFHLLSNMIGEFGINWDKNPDGTINFDVPQGPVGKLANDLSKAMMELPQEERYDCAVTIMSLLELFLGNDLTGENSLFGTGDIKFADLSDVKGFLEIGLPLIVNVLINSDYSVEAIKKFGTNEDLVVILNELQKYAKDNGITNFAGYIAEDPLRLIRIYSSMDLGKETIHKAITSFFTPQRIATILLVVSELARVCPLLVTKVAAVASFVAAVTAIALIAKHIYNNWDEIVLKIKDTTQQIMKYISDKFTELVDVIETQFNKLLNTVVDFAKKAIVKGKQIINSTITTTINFFDMLKDKAVDAIKKSYQFTKECLYRVAEGVYRYVQKAVSLDYTVLNDCVDRMNSLAARVSAIDERLDNLYLAIIKKDIEEEKGVFTSIANLYNITSADLRVDQAYIVRRKARQIAELYEGYITADNWVRSHLPKCR